MAELFPLEPFPVRVTYRVAGQARRLQMQLDPPGFGQARFDEQGDDLSLAVRLSVDEDGLTVDCTVTAQVAEMTLDSIEPLALNAPAAGDEVRFFHNGWESWSGSSSVGRQERERRPRLGGWTNDVITNPTAPRLRGPGHHASDLVTVAAMAEGPGAVLFGYLGAASQFGLFEIEADPGRVPRVTARLPFDGVPLAAGESRRAETLWVCWGESAPELLELWAARIGAAMDARVPAHSEVGWCSWYYYFTGISDQLIRENLDSLASLGDALPLELFQIDDGYQAALGQWTETNDKFPDGLAPLVEVIVDHGYRPGLWLAPFVARKEAPILREHPDWFVRDEADRPRYALYNPDWGRLGTAKALDTTHPDVLAWLQRVFRTVTGAWGFRFVKIDFLYAAALPGRRYDPRATGAEALRRGLQAIRDAVGPEVHILGCGCPLGPAIGLVDSMRIGIDVAPFWSSLFSRFIGRDYDMLCTKNALRNIFSRSFMHGRLWQNDPDCLLVRDTNTKLTRDEVLSLATICALSGGTMLVSDDLTRLAPERMAVARRAIEINREIGTRTPRCLDLMRSEFPGLLWAPRAGGGGYLAVLNPADQLASPVVALGDHRELIAWSTVDALDEVWSEEPQPVVDGVLDLGPVPAHGVRLLRFDPLEG